MGTPGGTVVRQSPRGQLDIQPPTIISFVEVGTRTQERALGLKSHDGEVALRQP
jgi:hypothetical protein